MHQLVERTTALVTGQHRQVAESIGVTPHALACWRSGKRRPTPDNVARLGRELLRRARELQFAGYELLRAADEMREHPGEVTEHTPEELTLFR